MELPGLHRWGLGMEAEVRLAKVVESHLVALTLEHLEVEEEEEERKRRKSLELPSLAVWLSLVVLPLEKLGREKLDLEVERVEVWKDLEIEIGRIERSVQLEEALRE